MSKQILFYVPYDFSSLKSGSQIRPYNMYKAFLNLGYEVDLIAGNIKTRKEAFKEIRKKQKKYIFCYSEPSTYPLHPFVDYNIYLYIKKQHIPIAIYYRDAYWKFSEYFNKRGIKKLELLLRYRADLFLYNHIASVIFFPTSTLANMFNIRVKKLCLPPGGENKFKNRNNLISSPLKGIYVGGINFRYGFDILLHAFSLVNNRQRVELELVCRDKEFKNISKEMKNFIDCSWINIHHISGKVLERLYYKAHFGIIPRRKDKYNDLAIPVKLFEYLSFGIPVIVTDCNEMGRFVKKNECGLVCKDTPESLADSILKLINDFGLYEYLSKKAKKTILNGNLWIDRAKTVESILVGNKYK